MTVCGRFGFAAGDAALNYLIEIEAFGFKDFFRSLPVRWRAVAIVEFGYALGHLFGENGVVKKSAVEFRDSEQIFIAFEGYVTWRDPSALFDLFECLILPERTLLF